MTKPHQVRGVPTSDAEIKQLERCKKARASVESERTKLEALRQHVPFTPQFDHVLRYEASLERNFDRTLGHSNVFSGCGSVT